MKDLEIRLLSELMKNSRRSDRELAKAVGSSQPTVTRVRTKLEKEGYIKEYTMIPDFNKLEYELMAFTFIKFGRMYTPEQVKRAREGAVDFLRKGPQEIVLIERGTGLDSHGIFVSLHKDYTSYLKFTEWVRNEISGEIDVADMQSFIVSLAGSVHYRPFTLSTLAKHMVAKESGRIQGAE